MFRFFSFRSILADIINYSIQQSLKSGHSFYPISSSSKISAYVISAGAFTHRQTFRPLPPSYGLILSSESTVAVLNPIISLYQERLVKFTAINPRSLYSIRINC